MSRMPDVLEGKGYRFSVRARHIPCAWTDGNGIWQCTQWVRRREHQTFQTVTNSTACTANTTWRARMENRKRAGKA